MNNGRKTVSHRVLALALAASSVLGLTLSGSVFGNGVVNQVHVGGPDICAAFGLNPGCDKNFSLSARKFADGSVSGQYVDRWVGTGNGFIAEVDCLHVEEFGDVKVAWVSGFVKQGSSDGVDLAGLPVWTAAVDIGTSAQDEFPRDVMTFSFLGDATSCTTMPGFPGIPSFQGQVTIK